MNSRRSLALAAVSLLGLACEAPAAPVCDLPDAEVDVVDAFVAPVDAARPPPFVGPSGETAGCGTAFEGHGLIDRTLTVRGVERRYRLAIPESYDEGTTHALVFAFHGLGDRAENFQAALRFEQLAGGEAIVVYPHGVYPALGSNGWDLDPAGADFELVDTLLASLSDELCVDRARVHALGFSYGAFMTNALGCHRGEVLRAIAPMAGSPPSGACSGQVAAWLVHGEADTVVSYSPLGTRARDLWRRRNGCADTGPVDGNGCTAYQGCDEGYPVTFCSHPGGHTVPAYAPAAIWSFFLALPE
jgi:polyhydroxybutyrate depolymerase